MQSEEVWVEYARNCSHDELESSIVQVMDLKQNFARKALRPGGKRKRTADATSIRMGRYLDIAMAIYADRFGEWCPF